MNPICPYCKQPAVLVTGKEIYPLREDLRNIKIWACDPCGARVGCHNGTNKPKGTLANEETRGWRMQAHKAFDPIWQEGNMDRDRAYRWLAKKLGINPNKCHIGTFNKFMCERVVKVCKSGV